MSILDSLQANFSKPACRRPGRGKMHLKYHQQDSETLEVRQLLSAQAIVVRESDVTVIEGRQNGRLDVRLSVPPTGNVQVNAARVSGDSDITVNNSVMVFTPTDWDVYQPFNLSAAQDADQANGAATIRLTATGLMSVDVIVQERDNDRPLGIEFETIDSVEVSSVTVPESRTATILVRLTGDPLGSRSVNVQRSTGDASFEVIRGSQVVFNSSNWNRFQPVVVAANSDSDTVDGTATL